MIEGRLHGAGFAEIGEVGAIAEGPAAIALSRGGAKKTYSHTDPNEDSVGFAYSTWGLLAVVADGHHGCGGAEAAVERVLTHHAPRWIDSGALALESRFVDEAPDVLHDINLAMVRAAGPGREDPPGTTLSVALARPRDGFLACLSIGDSHVFVLKGHDAQEWLPARGRSLFLGHPSHDTTRLGKALRAEVCLIDGIRGLALATDGLSEQGIGVASPPAAVREALASTRADDRAPLDLVHGIVDRALTAHRNNNAGDNAGAAALLWEAPGSPSPTL